MRMKNFKKAATYHQLIPECCPRSQLHKCGGWPKMSNHPGCVNVIWWTTTASRMFVKVMDAGLILLKENFFTPILLGML